jgi:predicted NACHT family NTPase
MSLTDGGYLDDPDAEWGRCSNPDVVPFETIASFPCLGLLGEPGIGKTRTMQTQRTAIDTQVEEEGGQTLWLDLRSYGSEERLIRDLFGNSTFCAWTNWTFRLHIFLDSLDECLLRINAVATILVEEFQKYSTLLDRLSLRIACRTADWPSTLEEGLRALWGKDAAAMYELALLRRNDIRNDIIEAARANDLDAHAFLREIDRMAVVPFAIKPVTLNFLLNTYGRKGRFPPTQIELYRQGCQLLCEETNSSRRDARLTGSLTPEQRMAIAARIAAVAIFANRYAIWTSPDKGDIPDEDAPIRQLYGRSENARGAGHRKTIGQSSVVSFETV